jgi:predicted  nucleic acid-binding Zn-ribbon protein
MWKQLAELMAQLLTFARDIQQNRTDIKELREELKATQQEFRQLALVVERLMYEVHRSTERAENDREKMALQLENALLKFASARQSRLG